MLLYRNIVMNAITEVIEPSLRKIMNQSLTSIFGQHWFESNGREILESYQYYDEIDYAIRNGINPLDAMDIPALVYILDPHISSDDEDDMENCWSGYKLINEIAQFYNWDEKQKRRILRLRQIRNGSFHDKMDKNLLLSPETIKNGVQENKWLDELEQAVLLMDPMGNLNVYRNELSKAISQENNVSVNHNKQSAVPNGVINYIREIESIRNDCQRVFRVDFMDAPVKAPIVGKAPWSDVKTDLDNLPWPSKMKEQKIQEEAAKKNQKVEQVPYDSVNKVFDSVDKGVNKLFGWLNKKI